jgi:D-mannonate dehydratase
MRTLDIRMWIDTVRRLAAMKVSAVSYALIMNNMTRTRTGNSYD